MKTREERLEAKRVYFQSEKGQATWQRYKNSPAGKATELRYTQSPRGKETKRRNHISPAGLACEQRRRASGRGEWSHKKYRQTEKGKLALLRTYLKGYGLDIKSYEKMLARQNRVCAICGAANADGRRLCIDHCHTTGRVRALLCNSCNAMIGHAKENVLVLYKAADYVEEHGRKK
jgi:hypothetical protein